MLFIQMASEYYPKYKNEMTQHVHIEISGLTEN